MKDPFEQLQKDQNGNVITNPVIGWISGTVAGMNVLLAIRSARSPEEYETGGTQMQYPLTYKQALELADDLKKQAERLIGPSSEPLH